MKKNKHSQARQVKKEQEEQMSPLEMLLTGKAGPLPIDVSDGETQSLASDANSEILYQDLVDAIMKNHPGLTEAETLRMIDAFG